MRDQATRRAAVAEAVASNTFCTLATSSADNRPHVAGVLYALVGRDLYINTDATSRKARNIGENQRVAVCIPVPVDTQAPPYLFPPGVQAPQVEALRPDSFHANQPYPNAGSSAAHDPLFDY